LDIHEHGSNVSLKAKRGDTGRILYITLMDGRNPYIISDDSYAVFTAKKADGTILFNHCSIIGNTICYAFTPKTTAAAGKLECEIKIYGAGNKLLTGAQFSLIVEETVYNEELVVGAEKEVGALTELMSKASALIYHIESELAKGKLLKGDTGDTGPQGERGPQGISYVATNIPTGYFALEMDSATGDLYCVTEEGVTAPTFTMDENGNIYHEIKEG
jgi:hypothetical protein